MLNKEITYNGTSNQCRLDKWLVDNNVLPDLSRAIAHNMIKGKAVLINGKIVHTGYKLRPNDIIQIHSLPEPEAKSIIVEASETIAPILDIKQYIVQDTPDFVVIDKPANILVHEDAKHKTGTLINALLELYPKMSTIDSSNRPGVVHRLDKDVSGLIVFAKTKKMFACLKSQFQNRVVQKKYLALVHGKIAKPEGVIKFNIARSTQYAKMSARPSGTSGKEAITEWTVVKQYQHYTLVSIKTITGRTNQIRLHFNAIDHPLVGDHVYSSTRYKNRNRNLNRILLHACYLSFNNILDEQLEFTSKPPPVFENFLKGLAEN
jgi:23S rRNA pseudouridine1911/1915/1917 synthase